MTIWSCRNAALEKTYVNGNDRFVFVVAKERKEERLVEDLVPELRGNPPLLLVLTQLNRSQQKKTSPKNKYPALINDWLH
jgi:hypothetical protein